METPTTTDTSRDEFEAAYVDHVNAKYAGPAAQKRDVASLREGDSYRGRSPYLNGCWQGWQMARAAQPAAADISNAKHTPGPWAVKGNRIEGPDGETVAYVTEYETLTPRQQANARLLYAARTLYIEAFELIGDIDPENKDRRFDGLRAAIAKAEGR